MPSDTPPPGGARPPKLIALWSAPRSRSTAFLRMMIERGDVLALHEPFSTLADIGRVDVAGTTVRSELELMDALRALATHATVFFKDTTDFHYPAVLADERFLREATHTFLIRHPREVIASHHRLNPALTRDEIGIERLHELFAAAWAAGDAPPLVIDSDDLLARPDRVVAAYCAHVGLPFMARSIRWSSRRRPEWERASCWHTEVVESTGFERGRTAPAVDVEGNPRLAGFYRFHLPFYRRLHEARWVEISHPTATGISG